VLELVTTALCTFLEAQPNLADQVPQLGFLPKVFQSMRSAAAQSNNAIPKSALQVWCCLCRSAVCLRAMPSVQLVGGVQEGGVGGCLPAVMAALRGRSDCLQLGAEALDRLFDLGEEDLAAQAIDCGLIAFLLELLESPHLLAADSPRAAVALVVKAIKTLQAKTVRHADRLNALLEASQAWKQYKDQLHDLFIQSAPIAGYLTCTPPIPPSHHPTLPPSTPHTHCTYILHLASAYLITLPLPSSLFLLPSFCLTCIFIRLC